MLFLDFRASMKYGCDKARRKRRRSMGQFLQGNDRLNFFTRRQETHGGNH